MSRAHGCCSVRGGSDRCSEVQRVHRLRAEKYLLLTTFHPDAFINVTFLMWSTLTKPAVLSQVQKSKSETRSEVTRSYWEELEVYCHFVLNGENPIFHLAENKALPDWLNAEKQAFGIQTFSVLTHTESGFYAPFHWIFSYPVPQATSIKLSPPNGAYADRSSLWIH